MSQQGPGRGWQAVIEELRRRHGWRLDDQIGRGGFGVVFREKVDGTDLAVKISLDAMDVLAGQLPDTDAPARPDIGQGAVSDVVQRELESLRLLSSLDKHPHLLPLIRYEVVLGHLVTVWELATGGTLLDRLRDYQDQQRRNAPKGGEPSPSAGLPLEELMPYMEQLAQAVDFLNSRGVYHRDVKPQNVFLCGGQVKLGDLGFLKLAGGSTQSHTGIGTMGYLPPEAYPQPGGRSGQLHRTIDVYGLAATYVHLRTGRAPFGESPHEVLSRQLRGEPCSEGMHAAEAEWVRQALSPDKDRRPASAQKFVQGLVNTLTLAMTRARPWADLRLPDTRSVRVYWAPREYVAGSLPPLSEELQRLQNAYLAVERTIPHVEDGSHPDLQAALAVVGQAEAMAQQFREELEKLPLPEGVTVEIRETLWGELVKNPQQQPSFFLRYCPQAQVQS
ncbi:MAG: protein kinase, partial [Gemmatales bacterium]|nr:protein kinase [Gemmatales bacterium]